MPFLLPPEPGHRQTQIGRQINRAIDNALLTERAAQQHRGYLGASSIGEACDRKLVLEYQGNAGEVDAHLLRAFAAGHVFEELLARWLRLAGFDLRDVDPNTGQQYSFEIAGGRVRGHCDGVIVDGPDLGVAYPVLWEAKALNEVSWLDLTRRGVMQSKPIYFAQVQTYMSHLQIERCLFTALNKNTAALYHELVALDPAYAQQLSERAVRLVDLAEENELPPRIDDLRECRDCRVATPCRAHGAGTDR